MGDAFLTACRNITPCRKPPANALEYARHKWEILTRLDLTFRFRQGLEHIYNTAIVIVSHRHNGSNTYF